MHDGLNSVGIPFTVCTTEIYLLTCFDKFPENINLSSS